MVATCKTYSHLNILNHLFICGEHEVKGISTFDWNVDHLSNKAVIRKLYQRHSLEASDNQVTIQRTVEIPDQYCVTQNHT